MEKPIHSRKTRFNLLICFLIAAACWFMMKMSKTYHVDYTYQLSLKNVPETKMVSYQSDSTLIVTLEDKGLSLLGAEFRAKRIMLDYETLFTDYQKGRNSVRVTQSQLMEYLRKERRFSNSLQTINLGGVHFTFTNAPQKEKK